MSSFSSSPLTIVHAVFSARIAGAERHALDLAAAQAERGHHVHLVGPWRSDLRGCVPPRVSYHGLMSPLWRAARLRALVRELQADVVHGHLGPACKSVARCGGAARLGTLHVGYKAHQHGRLDGVICVNNAQKSSTRAFQGEVRVIHNWPPQPTARKTRPGDPKNIREELGLSHHRLLVGCVARLHPSKGVDVLINAFLSDASLDATLVIMGEGREARSLRRLAAYDSRIRFLGFREDVDEILTSLDLLVSPSREEALPLAVLEAMRAGLPIVATRTDGALQLLSDETATLVAVDDPIEMGAALRAALRTMTTQHGTRILPPWRVRYDLSRYDRSFAVDQVDALYRDLLLRQVPAELDLDTV